MNTDKDIDIEDMRSAWQGWCVSEPQKFDPDKKIAILDHRGKLLRQQCAIIVLGAVWSLLSVPLLCLNPVINFPIWAGIYLSVYFAVLAVFALFQYYAYKDIDMYSMSVRQCLAAELKAKTLHMRIKIIGYVIAIPTVVYLLWFFYHVNMATFAGAVCGLVLGLCIGIMMEMRMRRHLRRMSRYLESLDQDCSRDI